METTFSATGRRKSSIARVIVKPGKGDKTVNGNTIKEYLKSDTLVSIVEQPLKLLNVSENYDIVVSVRGGGLSGQSGAIRLGVSRALAQIDEASRRTMRKNGFLTRDSREVERKKYGLAGARKRYQFSKR